MSQGRQDAPAFIHRAAAFSDSIIANAFERELKPSEIAMACTLTLAKIIEAVETNNPGLLYGAGTGQPH